MTSFGKERYMALKHDLMTRPNGWINLGVLVVMCGLAATATCLSEMAWFWWCLSQPLMAVAFFQGFALLHECGHASAAARGWANTAMGHVASLFCFLPFYPWRYIHNEHHAWTGNLERDPVLGAVRRWKDAGSIPPFVRAIWRSWIPLPALLQQLVFWAYPLTILKQGDRRRIVRSVLSVAWIAACYAIAIGLGFRPWLFIPAIVLYLVMSEAVNIPHHVGLSPVDNRLPPWEQWRSTRTCVYPTGIGEFLVMNFNFHVEHHLFPALPWYRLRDAHLRLRKEIGQGYMEERGLSWIFRNRTKDMNTVFFPK